MILCHYPGVNHLGSRWVDSFEMVSMALEFMEMKVSLLLLFIDLFIEIEVECPPLVCLFICVDVAVVSSYLFNC